MKTGYHTFIVTALFLLQGCSQNDVYNQKTKTLDSLSGALNLKIKELEKTDTALLQRCITRYTYYRQFIKQNVNDTVTKNEADKLQQFYNSGQNLASFAANRVSILGRASLINSQQNKLAADIKNRSIELPETEKYLQGEREASAKVIEAAEAQQKLFYTSLEEFKNSLKDVEQLIRTHNNGQLPTIIKDTLSL